MAQGKTAKDSRDALQKNMSEGDYVKWLEEDAVRSGATNAMLSWMKVVEVVEAERLSHSSARVVYRFPVQREYLNRDMKLHGGTAAGMYDKATTGLLRLIKKPGFWMHNGVTRSLNLTYLRPAAEGEMLRMECETVHVGKRLCLLKGVLMREKDRAIISTCEHQKYNTDTDTKV